MFLHNKNYKKFCSLVISSVNIANVNQYFCSISWPPDRSTKGESPRRGHRGHANSGCQQWAASDNAQRCSAACTERHKRRECVKCNDGSDSLASSYGAEEEKRGGRGGEAIEGTWWEEVICSEMPFGHFVSV